MKINNNKITLAIFDLDGTLIDSTSLWHLVDEKFFQKRGMEIPENYAKEIAHIGLKAAAKLTKEKYLPNEEINDILKEWNELSLIEYKENIELKPNARKLLKKLYRKGIKIALATANSKELYEPCLKRLKIDKYFSFIIDVNSCKEGKSSPEIYNKVAEHFNTTISSTVVFEDNLVPIQTAYNAGYNVIAVYDINSTKDLEATKNHSHKLIYDFKELLTLNISKPCKVFLILSLIALIISFLLFLYGLIYMMVVKGVATFVFVVFSLVYAPIGLGVTALLAIIALIIHLVDKKNMKKRMA